MNRAPLKTKAQAWAAAMSHGMPARKLKIIVVSGPDGADTTVAFLAQMLTAANQRVGVIARDFVQIAGERAAGSDQAQPLGDTSRLHQLLAQMRRAKCTYVIIEQPPVMPVHQFIGVPLTMVIVRRCGDAHLPATDTAARVSLAKTLLRRHPRFEVLPRDDACFETLQPPGKAGVMTFGTHLQSECRITNVELRPKGSVAELMIDHHVPLTIGTHLAGKQALSSAVAAAAAAYLLHVPVEAIQDGAADMEPVSTHAEFLPIMRPYRIMLDCSYTPDGIAETLEAARHFTQNRVITVVSANIEQPAQWLQPIGEIAARLSDRVIVTDGEYSPGIAPDHLRNQLLSGLALHGGEAKIKVIASRQAAIKKALSIARRGDTIVLSSVTTHPYRQLGDERAHWSDSDVIRQILEG